MKSKKTDEYIDDVPDNYKLVTEGTLQSGDLIFSLGSNFYNIKRGWHKVRQEDIGGTLQHLHGVCRKAESEEK